MLGDAAADPPSHGTGPRIARPRIMSLPRRPTSVVVWAAAALLAYLVFLIVRPFLTSLAWAAVIAIVCQPLQARLRYRMNESRSALVTTLIATVAVIGPLSFLATAFVSEGLDAANHLQHAAAGGALESAQGAVSKLLDMVPVLRSFDLRAALLDGAQRAAVVLGGYSTAVLRHTATFLFDLTLALFASFFLLRDGSRIVDVLRNVTPLDDPQRERLFSDTASLITVSVRSSLFVAALQGFLGGCVFAVVGIAAPVFWGVVMAVCCLLPLGAWVIWAPAAILLAVGGNVGRAIVVAVLGFGVVSAVDNFVRPMLLTGTTRMNGLLVFISLLGGMAAFGAVGLVLGPVVMATGTTIVTTYAESRAGTHRR